MYFHVHIISILAAIALHRKHKTRDPSATTKRFSLASSFSSSCSAQCQPVHSNNNDKVDWKAPLHDLLPGSHSHSSVLSETSEYPPRAFNRLQMGNQCVIYSFGTYGIWNYGTGCALEETFHHIARDNASDFGSAGWLEGETWAEGVSLLLPWAPLGPWPPSTILHAHLNTSLPAAPATMRQCEERKEAHFFSLSSVCTLLPHGGMKARAVGEQLKHGTNTRTHTHTHTCMNRHSEQTCTYSLLDTACTWSHSDGTQRLPLCGHNKRACHGEREPMYPLHPLCPEDLFVCVCV